MSALIIDCFKIWPGRWNSTGKLSIADYWGADWRGWLLQPPSPTVCARNQLLIQHCALQRWPACWFGDPLDGPFEGASWTLCMAIQVMEFSNGGYRIRKVFCLRINILKGNYLILRIGLVGASEVFKNQSLKVNYFHLLSKKYHILKSWLNFNALIVFH